MTTALVYLDNAAATPIHAEAYKTLMKSAKEDFANPSGANRLSLALNKRIAQARLDFLHWLEADEDQYKVIFTSSATESNNMAILGSHLEKNDEIFYSEADHPSLSAPCKTLQTQGIILKELPLLKTGQINTAELLNQITEKTKLVIISHVNSLAGIIQPIEDLCLQIKEKNSDCKIHIDAAQSFGKIPLSLKNSNIDSVSIASYKLGGPKGIAALIIHNGNHLKPLLFGGDHEFGLRASTPSAPLIFSFHTAAQYSIEERKIHQIQLEELNSLARSMLEKCASVLTPFQQKDCSPYFLLLIVPNIPADVLSRHLEQANIIVNTRTSCSSKTNKPTPMLAALYIPLEQQKNVLRITFSMNNTEAEIHYFCNTLMQTIQQIQKIVKK